VIWEVNLSILHVFQPEAESLVVSPDEEPPVLPFHRLLEAMVVSMESWCLSRRVRATLYSFPSTSKVTV